MQILKKILERRIQMSNVILKNFTKKFKDVTAVDDLNIEIKDKEFAVLVGVRPGVERPLPYEPLPGWRKPL